MLEETSKPMFSLVAKINKDLQRLFNAGVFHVLVLVVGMRGAAFIQQIGLARILSQEDLGKAIFILRILSIAEIFADLGISTGVLKYSAENVDEHRKGTIFKTGLVAVFFIGLVASSMFALTVFVSNAFGDRDVLLLMLLCSFYIPFSALRKLPPLYMQAQKELQRAVKISAVSQIFMIACVLLFAYLFGLNGYLAVLVVGQAAILLAFLLITRQAYLGIKARWSVFKELLQFGFFSMLANFTGIINATLSIILLKSFRFSYEEIAIYGIASTIVEALRLAPKSMLRTIFPYLVSAKDDPKQLKRKVQELMIKQGMVVFLMAVSVSIAGYWAIPLLFGEIYSASWPCVVVLSGALTLWSVSAPFGQLQIALNNVRVNFAISILQLLANFAFGVLLVPEHGAIGAALALLLSRCLHCVVQVAVGHRLLNSKLQEQA